MNREQALATLLSHKAELEKAGVISLSLFGSTARGDAENGSDVDVAVRLNEGFSNGGFDFFGCLAILEDQLSRMLGCEVDVVEEPVRKPRLQALINKDRAVAF